jgi:hypothetical protein
MLREERQRRAPPRFANASVRSYTTNRKKLMRVLASSIVSDMNNGCSSFVDGQVVVSLSNQEGILEIEIG